MFDIASTELLLIAVVAVLVIGPKDLPRALYKFGQVVGKARGMARHFRSGIDAMVREAELEELQKQWAAQNQKIMNETRKTEAGGEASDSTSEAAEPSLIAPELVADDKAAPAADLTVESARDESTGPEVSDSKDRKDDADQASLPLDMSDGPTGSRTA
mgnify:CR=1 FL=1